MPALPELQRRFGAALRGGDSAAIESCIRAAGIEPARRVAIYRNNWRENALATLAAAFPVLKRLVGDDYFRQMAREFLADHPSPSGDLQHLGAPLGRFLAERHGGSAYAYLADVARLEWAFQEVLVAAGHAALDVRRLAAVPQPQWPQLGFVLHPAVRLVRSAFPVLTIWSAHQPRPDGSGAAIIDDTIIDLGLGGEFVLLRRTDSAVELHRLPHAEFALLEVLARGATLSAAADAAAVLDPGFDVSHALQRQVLLAVLVDFTVPAAPSPTDGD
jgi:hypothetical protein